jgi:hypothetical protein
MAEKSQDRLIKVPAYKAQRLLSGHHGEGRNDIKSDEDISGSISKSVNRFSPMKIARFLRSVTDELGLKTLVVHSIH